MVGYFSLNFQTLNKTIISLICYLVGARGIEPRLQAPHARGLPLSYAPLTLNFKPNNCSFQQNEILS